ncbi:hypothetical protein ES288_A13G096900v1 [Gossypium darwinii]|uniref:Uncharacterized protein n=1 Tax=Gossypium darwinii TaxID=34276 RepID=A0A5D2DY16_GOSDA|nr:hypothetical protein ES288_A13G096900v1 [Gossypium darwinii]
MASTSSATASSDPELYLIKQVIFLPLNFLCLMILYLFQIRTHEVAIAELGSLSSWRTVYQKNGHLFFRTSIQKATSSEEKQLDQAKAKLEKLNSQ